MKLTPTIARQLNLHRSVRAALVEILLIANGRPAIRTTQEALAGRLGVSVRSVRRQLAALEAEGLIERAENRSASTGYKASTTISIGQVVVTGQGDKMAGKKRPANRSGCPVGQAAKMSAIIEDSSKSGDRDHESGRRAGDAGASGAPRFEPVNDGAMLKLIPGGRAA